MGRLNRFLKITFLILILVTTVEIIYYIFILNSNTILSSVPGKKLNTTLNLSEVISTEEFKTAKPTINKSLYLDMNTLKDLAGMKRDVLKSAFVNREFVGTIKELDLKSGYIPNSKIEYKVKLVLHGSQNGIINFYFIQNDLAKTKVISIENNRETPIKISDLKLNDYITIKDTLDLTKDSYSNLVESLISKK